MKKPTGYVIYKGASLIDGKPIVVIANISSVNAKTGNAIQTTILRDDIDPLLANKTGEDYSICGTCPHEREHQVMTLTGKLRLIALVMSI